MGSTRIKGAALKLTLGTPGTDYWADITAATIEPEDADQETVTFEDAAAGDVSEYHLKITAIQSTATASFWRYVWENAGSKVPFTFAPHGNAAPSVDQPHFVGEVTIGPSPAIGGEAGKDNTYTFETDWVCAAKPTLTTGA